MRVDTNKETTTVNDIPEEIVNKSNYKVVDTNQGFCSDNNSVIDCSSTDFPLQDGALISNAPNYTDNKDGTITDNITGLTWQKDPGEKITYDSAMQKAKDFTFAGYSDWRVPTIKELYSLMDFSGTDPSSMTSTDNLVPFINTNYFDFSYGDTSTGDRIIDSQWITSSIYTSTVMNNQKCFFGVNFADGRIKCYPMNDSKTYFMILVRGNENYGENDFEEISDLVIYDNATDLYWQKNDSGVGMFWEDALNYCSDLQQGGYDDWRLPNAKELQSIVDYSKSPDKTNSPSANDIFIFSSINNEQGKKDYPYYWSSTTHLKSNGNLSNAVYISFGEAIGQMSGTWMDVHGAGAQRSDPKTGNVTTDSESTANGPQGDAVRILNYVRCVRGGNLKINTENDYDKYNFNSDDSKSTTPEQQKTDMKLPPIEAINACANKAINISCSFNAGQSVISGTCAEVQDVIACIPK